MPHPAITTDMAFNKKPRQRLVLGGYCKGKVIIKLVGSYVFSSWIGFVGVRQPPVIYAIYDTRYQFCDLTASFWAMILVWRCKTYLFCWSFLMVIKSWARALRARIFCGKHEIRWKSFQNSSKSDWWRSWRFKSVFLSYDICDSVQKMKVVLS